MAHMMHDMSDDERALMDAILAAPEDDAPRLVYADWLEEHGQADQAELIRLQVGLAAAGRWPDDLDRYWELEGRARAAIDPFTRPLHVHVEFERGMPERLYLTPEADLDRGPGRVCREMPIVALNLFEVDDLPRTAAALGPAVRARLRALVWNGGCLDDLGTRRAEQAPVAVERALDCLAAPGWSRVCSGSKSSATRWTHARPRPWSRPVTPAISSPWLFSVGA